MSYSYLAPALRPPPNRGITDEPPADARVIEVHVYNILLSYEVNLPGDRFRFTWSLHRLVMENFQDVAVSSDLGPGGSVLL
jgi:hypothetical protein